MKTKTFGDFKVDLESLSIGDLESLQKAIGTRIEHLKVEGLRQALSSLDEMAKSLGLESSQIVSHYAGTKRSFSRRPAAQKYRNPNDASQTWSGRGRQPLWVRSHLAAGGSLDTLH